jgi:hypothetical protein
MAKVVFEMAMSLDGFVQDRNVSAGRKLAGRSAGDM